MQESDRHNIAIDGSLGIFTTVALILLLWGLCWLKSFYPFYAKQYINVIFPNVGGLHASAAVYVDGVRAGMVESVNWKNPNQVLVRLRITHPSMIIPVGSRFSIFANGVIGARYVDISLPNTNNEPPIDESTIVTGEAALRPEVVLDKLGRDIDAIDLDKLNHRITADEKILRKAASQFSSLAEKTGPVIDRAVPLEENLTALSKQINRTLYRLNKFADNPSLSSDWRDVINKTNETVHLAQQAIRDLDKIFHDEPLKNDIGNTMVNLDRATAQFEKSIVELHQVSKDQNLRSDIKQILIDLRKALDKLDDILRNPDSGDEVKSTLKNTCATLSDIDIAARQLQQILDKRHPLMHMFLGRPGHLEKEDLDLKEK